MTPQTQDALTHEPIAFQNIQLRERLLRRAISNPGLHREHHRQLSTFAHALANYPQTAGDAVEHYLPRPPSADPVLVSMLGVSSYDPPWVEGVINVFGAYYHSVPSLSERGKGLRAIQGTLDAMARPSTRFTNVLGGTDSGQVVPTVLRAIDLPSLYLPLASADQRQNDIGSITTRIHEAATQGKDALHRESRRLLRDSGLAPLTFALASARIPEENSANAYALIDRIFPGYTQHLPRSLVPTRYKAKSTE